MISTIDQENGPGISVTANRNIRRYPTDAEIALGAPYLQSLIRLFTGTTLAAVGKKAVGSLAKMGVPGVHGPESGRTQPSGPRKYEKTLRGGLRTFSWFVYRITTPALRKMFMSLRNWFRMEEAILSLLTADIFRGTRAAPDRCLCSR